MDSSVSPTHGDQEQSVWNGHFGCTCYHPLFVFNQFGDLERCALRPGNVHSADDWEACSSRSSRVTKGKAHAFAFRGDAAFATPSMYEYLESEGIEYAIRLPANQILQGGDRSSASSRPVGGRRTTCSASTRRFRYQAGSWAHPRRVVAKVEWHLGELFPRVGFIVTNSTSQRSKNVVGILQPARNRRAAHKRGQRCDQMDAALVSHVRRKRCPTSASCTGLQPRQLPTNARDAGCDRGLDAHEFAREADQDRREGRQPRPLRHVPNGGGRNPTGSVCRAFAEDRCTTITAELRQHETVGGDPLVQTSGEVRPHEGATSLLGVQQGRCVLDLARNRPTPTCRAPETAGIIRPRSKSESHMGNPGLERTTQGLQVRKRGSLLGGIMGRRLLAMFAFLVCCTIGAAEKPARAQQTAPPPTPPAVQRTEGDFVIRDFRFQSGEQLPELRIHYVTLGTAEARCSRACEQRRVAASRFDVEQLPLSRAEFPRDEYRRGAVRSRLAARPGAVLHHHPRCDWARPLEQAKRWLARRFPPLRLQRHGRSPTPLAHRTARRRSSPPWSPASRWAGCKPFCGARNIPR